MITFSGTVESKDPALYDKIWKAVQEVIDAARSDDPNLRNTVSMHFNPNE